jgi:DNA invertase Pin-like site-specific DNA recombinase
MKIAIYARTSTEDQNVLQQTKKLKEFAKSKDWQVKKIIEDQESGRKPLFERKQFNKLLGRLDKYDAVLVFNIDRLTRNWEDESKLEDYFRGKCKLISMSDPVDLNSASGRLMFRIKMAVSTYMPEDMREKQKVGIERAKAEGKYKGGKKGRKWIK